MKTRILFFAMILSLFMGKNVFAQQTTVSIGLGERLDYNGDVPVSRLSEYSTNQTIYLATDINTSGNILSISYRADEGLEDTVRNIRVYMATTTLSAFTSVQDVLPASDFTLVFEGDWTIRDGEWGEIVLDNPFYYNGTDNLVIGFEDTTNHRNSTTEGWLSTLVNGRSICAYSYTHSVSLGTASYILNAYPDIKIVFGNADNFCGVVNGLTIEYIQPESAKIVWDSRDEQANFVYEYKKSTDEWTDEESVHQGVVSINEVVLSDLDIFTTYDFRVKADCGLSQTYWQDTVFRTSCAVINVTNDNEWLATFQTPPDCWTLKNYNNLYTDYLRGTGEAVSPYLNITNLTHPYLKLKYKDYTNRLYTGLKVFYRNSVEDEWTYLTFFKKEGANWITDSIHLPNAGATYQIKLQSLDGCRVDIDSVEVYNLPTLPVCNSPYALQVGDVTEHTANISWQAVDENSIFKLYYKRSFELDYTVIDNITETHYEFTDLSASSYYVFYVATVCQQDNEVPSSIRYFQTPCGAVTLPYFEDFEFSDKIPNCYDTVCSYPHDIYVSQSSSFTQHYPYMKRGVLHIVSHTDDYSYFILPKMAENINDVYVSFVSAVGYTPVSGELQVGIMEDAEDTSTFIPVYTLISTDYTNSSYAGHNVVKPYPDSVSFAGVTVNSSDPVIAFRQKPYMHSNWEYYIDNIIVNRIGEYFNPYPCTPITETVEETFCEGSQYRYDDNHVYEQGGTYYIRKTTTLGCDSTVVLNLTAKPAQVTDEYIQIEEGKTVVIGGLLVINKEGTFAQNLQTAEGCDSTVLWHASYTSGIDDVENHINISLYPNPTQNKTTLQVDGLNTEATIQITDLQGRVVRKEFLPKGQDSITIETASLSEGVYYIKLYSEDINLTKKLIKQ
ncbi:MAG: T9SS type A sorting domain-containing protein [Bacteroidales bacterium]|nr:T9SS type A sorting domain-containing protein [Bacteroidales bacterium]